METTKKQIEKQIDQTILMVERLLRMDSVPKSELLVFAQWLNRFSEHDQAEFFERQTARWVSELDSVVEEVPHEQIVTLLAPVIDHLSERGRKKVVRKEMILSVTKRFLDNIQWKKALEQERYMTRFFGSIEDTLEVGYDLHVDAMLIDYEIIRMTNDALIVKLFKKLEASFIPLILIGPNDPGVRQACYALGTDDYWDETVGIDERKIRLKRLLRKLRTVSSSMLVDELTGAFNRKYLQNAYRRRTSRLERDGQLFALAIFDLDHFKRINDSHGHPTGDLVLTELAALTKQALRQDDELIRFGGEEFMVLFSADDSNHATEMMEKVRARIERHTFPNGLKVTVSIGLTVIDDVMLDLEEMTSEADEALYQAKRNGRNQVIVYAMATEKEKVKAVIKIEKSILPSLSLMEIPSHPKYDFDLVADNQKTVGAIQLYVMPLEELAASNFKLVDEWKQTRDQIIDVIAIAGEENQLLGQALERGVTDYCLSPLDPHQLEEQIRQWVIRLP